MIAFRKYFLVFLLLGSLPYRSLSQPATILDGKQIVQQADSLLNIDYMQSIELANFAMEQYGKDPKVYIGSNLVLGFAYKYKGEYDSSIVFSSKGLAKAQEIKDTINLILLYSSRGIVHYLKANYSNALTDFSAARDYYSCYGYADENSDLSSEHYAKILNNIATAYIKTGQYDSSLVHFIKSVKVREENNASTKLLLIGKFNIGSIYLTINDYLNGKVWLVDALNDAILINDSNLIAKCYSNLGIIHKKLGDTIMALDYYKKGLAMHERLSNERDQAIILQNLALLYINQNKHHKALEYSYKAYGKNNEINANNAGVHLGLSKVFLQMQKYDSTIYHGERALKLARESRNSQTQIEGWLLLYNAYKELGNSTNALYAFENYIELKDSVLNNKHQEYIEELKQSFETDRKEKEIEFLKKLNESDSIKAKAVQSRQQLFLLTMAMVLVLFIVLATSYYFKRKKEKELNIASRKLLESKLENKDLLGKELQLEVRFKTKQLTTHALNMMKKNQMLGNITKQLKDLSKQASNDFAMEFKNIIKEIDQSKKTDNDWDLFKKYFESVNKDFNGKLRAINPKLSANDFRLAALISLNLNIKESAALLNISPDSVKLARHRLRKRLYIESGEDLYLFLSKL